jgi:flagellar biosynthesis component FlhA
MAMTSSNPSLSVCLSACLPSISLLISACFSPYLFFIRLVQTGEEDEEEGDEEEDEEEREEEEDFPATHFLPGPKEKAFEV